MAKQIIDVGNSPDDGTGSKLRSGGTIINDNFTEIWERATIWQARTYQSKTTVNYQDDLYLLVAPVPFVSTDFASELANNDWKLIANKTDLDAYLKLSAGSGQKLTGDLYGLGAQFDNPVSGGDAVADQDFITKLQLENAESSAPTLFQFDYNFATNIDGTPANGKLELNDSDSSLATVVYFNKLDRTGRDMGLFLEQISEHDWLNIHDNNDINTHYAYDVTGDAVLNGVVYEIPVTFFSAGGSLSNNQRVDVLWKTNGRYLTKDGSALMDVGYLPTDDRQVANKEYVDIMSTRSTIQTNKYLLGTDVLFNQVVYLNNDGTWHLVEDDFAAFANDTNVFGIALTSGTIGQVIEVLIQGYIENAATTSHPAKIYAQPDGYLGSSSATRINNQSIELGKSASTTSLYFTGLNGTTKSYFQVPSAPYYFQSLSGGVIGSSAEFLNTVNGVTFYSIIGKYFRITGAQLTILGSDSNKFYIFTHTSLTNVGLDNGQFNEGTNMPIYHSGTANVTLVPESGVTITPKGRIGLVIKPGDYVSLVNIGTGEWLLVNEINDVLSDVTNEPTGSDEVNNMVSLTQAEYDNGTPNPKTSYYITDAV